MVQAWYGRWKVFDAETYQCFWERKTAVQFALFNINKTKQSVKYNRFVIQENYRGS